MVKEKDIMDYYYFKNLFQNSKFKKLYKEKCNEVMKRKGMEFGQWKHFEKNGEYGLVDENGIWCWRNAINTHPYCLHDFYYLYLESFKVELDFSDELYYRGKIERLWNFIEDNWELYFTTNKESKYFHKFRLRNNQSWTKGQITVIALGYNLKDLFGEIKEMKGSIDLERGGKNDFKGKDLIISGLNDGKKEIIVIQIKGGSYYYNEKKGGFLIKSAANNLDAQCDYYCFVDIQNNETDIILFKNEKSLIEKIDNDFFFPNEIFNNKKINKNMPVPQTLMLILQYCGKNDIVMNLKNTQGEKNNLQFIKTPEKVVNINIGDFKDENLESYLLSKFDELKEAFK